MVAPQQWRVSWSAAYGTFSTSHVAECPDVAPECAQTTIEPHLHRARLALTHYDLGVMYGLREGWQLNATLPYDVKAMHIRYTTLAGEPFMPPYGDIHHRTETLRGIGDASVALEHRIGEFVAGAGLTLPLGRTEPDPIVLGREGKRHEHLQFGSGTFQPRLALQYAHGALFARVEARLSVVENDEGFRAPSTFVWSLGPNVRALSLRFEGQHQTIGRWSGEIDEGSGFTNGGIRAAYAFRLGAFGVQPGVYRELFSRSHGDETFAQGTTWSLAVSRRF
ncbi:MAG TPA: hypothetical protein VF824_15950 [Thermoanaerobaculia bacterium]|jgi:hypothetical protein